MTNERADGPQRPLRILMVAPTSFFSEYGGHIRIYEETRALQQLGHKVTIVTYYKGDDVPGFDIRRTAPLPYRTDYEVGSSRHKLAFDLYLLVQAFIEGWRLKPDVVHGHMHEGALIGGVLARLLRVPMVFDFQGSLTAEMVDHNFLNPNGRFYRTVYRLERFISRRLPKAVLTSSVQAKTLLEEDFSVPPAMIHPLPDCADTHRFRPQRLTAVQKAELCRVHNIPEDKTIIAYLGLLTDYQGIPHLIQTAVRLREQNENVHFLVMGYPSVQHYQNMAQQNNVAHMMTFTGKMPYEKAPDYLALGDIAVAPKISSSEGSGKLLNYMAMAQPVVAFDSAVHREYLAEWGVYAPAGDVDAFAEQIRQLIHDPARREKLGAQLRRRAQQQYSWEQAGRTIEGVYSRLTKLQTNVTLEVRI